MHDLVWTTSELKEEEKIPHKFTLKYGAQDFLFCQQHHGLDWFEGTGERILLFHPDTIFNQKPK